MVCAYSAMCCVHTQQCVVCILSNVLCTYQAMCYVHTKQCVMYILSNVLCTNPAMCYVLYIPSNVLCAYPAMCYVHTQQCVMCIPSNVLCTFSAMCFVQTPQCVMYCTYPAMCYVHTQQFVIELTYRYPFCHYLPAKKSVFAYNLIWVSGIFIKLLFILPLWKLFVSRLRPLYDWTFPSKITLGECYVVTC